MDQQHIFNKGGIMKPKHIQHEQEYFMEEAQRLAGVPCPNCAEVMSLFRGGKYIGCRSCLTYFGEEHFK